MNYQEFVATAQQGAQKAESNDTDGALRIFRELAEGDLPEMDRSAMCLNVALLFERKGVAQDALRWYTRAVELESRHNRFAAAERKANYLAQIGKARESLAAFQQLLARTDLTLTDRERFARTLAQLEQQIAAS